MNKYINIIFTSIDLLIEIYRMEKIAEENNSINDIVIPVKFVENKA